MKKLNYFIKRRIVLLILLCVSLVSINSLKAQLNGTYTIGGSNPDYTTIAAAVSDLTTNGVSAPVTFNIRAGTYAEAINIGIIAGVSSTNTVVFQPDGAASVSIQYNSGSYVVALSGCDYVSFIDLSFTSTGSSGVLFITNGSDNITISGNTINASTLSTTSQSYSAIQLYSSSGNNIITNNTINNGSIGIYLQGISSSNRGNGNEISNNIIQNFTYKGIYSRYQDNMSINSNEITSLTGGSISTQFGIHTENCLFSSIFSNNKIQLNATYNNYGIYFVDCDANSSNRNIIANNIISNQNATNYSWGIHLYSSNYNSVYFNSINITDGNGGGGRALYAYYCTYVELINNIFANTKSSYAGYAIYIYPNYYPLTSDYNNLYSNGTYLGYYGSNKTNLSVWKSSGKDANSVSGDPLFTSATDLHLSSNSSPCFENATPISSYDLDIDGHPRDVSNPDIGADEIFYLNGTYTIGGTNPDYQTITDAVSDLTTYGISASVTFNIRAGTYNEQVVIGTIAGVSANDTIVFQPEASAAVTIQYNSWDAVKLNNTTYIGFYDLAFSSSNFKMFNLNSCSNITIRGNTINSANSTSNSQGNACIYSSNCSDIIISDNTINNGSYGIYLYGNSSSYKTGNIISNNTIQNFYTIGIYSQYQTGLIISSNEITSKTSGGYIYQYGIKAHNCNYSTLISKNKIQVYGTQENYGLYLYSCYGNSTERNKIINNTISNQMAVNYSRGIYLYNCTYTSAYFNSVNITDGKYGSYGVAMYAYNGNNLELFNNIFAITKASSNSGYAIYSNLTYNITTSDYNNFYTTGSTLGYLAGSKPNLAAWKTTGKDANSISEYPYYTSATDLHSTCTSCDGAATPISGITDDIDGETRNSSAPDIGADEISIPLIINGKTTRCSNVFTRMFSSGDFAYETFTFTVPVSGNYTITADWNKETGSPDANFDGYLYLYQSSFDPNNSTTNYLNHNDDFNGSTHSQIANQALVSNTDYIVVATTYAPRKFSMGGEMEFTIEGDVMPTIITPCTYGTKAAFGSVHSTNGLTYNVSFECDDDNGWTHYYNDNGTAYDLSDDNIILSVKKNSEEIGQVGDGTFALFVEGAAGATHIQSTTAPYVTSANGWYVYNRYWKLTPSSQPTSGVNVRSYYTQADFDALSTIISLNGGTPPSNHENTSFFKINSITGSYNPNPVYAHSGIPNASSYSADGCWIYTNGTASTDEWELGTHTGGKYGEFIVGHFSGGGGGAAHFSGDDDGSPLPIELLNFNAFASEGVNIIEWQTASETNVDFFEIERMTNSQNEFSKIAECKAKGNSNIQIDYRIIDNKPSQQAYYRLRTIDFDGKESVSDIVYVKRDYEGVSIFNVYPVPSSKDVSIIFNSSSDKKVHITASDVLGRTILNVDLFAIKGQNKFDINLEEFEQGTYFLTIDDNETKDRSVFIKN